MSNQVSRIGSSLKASLLTLTGAIALSSGAAHAQSGDQDTVAQITPYIWATGVGGSATPFPGGPTFESSRSFSELLEDLDAAFFVSGLFRKNRLVAVVDFSHAATSREGLVSTGSPALPVVPAEGRLKQTSMTLLGGYRAVEGTEVSVDLLAGTRIFWLDAEIAVPAVGISRSPTIDFIDPIVAARVNARIAEGWSLLAYGDIGGFGAGSEFTSQLVATVNARIASNVWISGGYRHLMVDYRGSTLQADAHMAGPLFGATLVF